MFGHFTNEGKIESLEREILEPNIDAGPENPPVALKGEMCGNFFARAAWSMLLGPSGGSISAKRRGKGTCRRR